MFFVGLLAVIAVLGALIIFDGDDTPTVTFDGVEAVYGGPTTFEAGQYEFHYDVSEYEPGVIIIVSQLLDDSVTFDDVKADAEENPASSTPPEYIGRFNMTTVTGETAEDRVVDKMVRLDDDTRYLITAHTSRSDTDRVFPAAIIEVE